MMQKQHSRSSSFRESLKALEADVQHANALAAALPREFGEDCIQMRLSYSPFAPFILFLIEWMDYSCTDTLPSFLGLLNVLVYKAYVDGMPTLSSKERRATLREFYAVIYPSLMQLEEEFLRMGDSQQRTDVVARKRVEDRDDECGICMENGPKVVLPTCGHALCISCFHDWNDRSQSCPFCRGSLKRVNSKDLWILTCSSDVVDMVTVAKENLRCFYLYVENLPLAMADVQSYGCDYMI